MFFTGKQNPETALFHFFLSHINILSFWNKQSQVVSYHKLFSRWSFAFDPLFRELGYPHLKVCIGKTYSQFCFHYDFEAHTAKQGLVKILRFALDQRLQF
jgi:hypothetical protein